MTMAWRRAARGAVIAGVGVAIAAGCGDSSVKLLRVRRAYMVVPAGTSPAAMYFTVENDGVWADTLISVSTPAAETAELHEAAPVVAAADTGARAVAARKASSPTPAAPALLMVPSSLVIVPAHTAMRFAPGGHHVMLMSPHAGLKRGDTVNVTFVFMRRGQLRARAAVISYADVDTATAAPPEVNP